MAEKITAQTSFVVLAEELVLVLRPRTNRWEHGTTMARVLTRL